MTQTALGTAQRVARATQAPRRGAPRLAERAVVAVAPRRPVEAMNWPESFDDWMIDIVRRRALRLNAGARRRGVHGSVRAVELAHILDVTRDANGRWICALCHEAVTLNDLSFDHVLALADGGEHAAHNLVPAHRKCNEIKGSEKAQSRAKALDRWLSEWSGSPRANGGSASTEASPAYFAAQTNATPATERRYA
ncbi:MAG: HNH endonuclease [Ktedonobacterales bacterium]